MNNVLKPDFTAVSGVFVKAFPLPAMNAGNDNCQAIFFGTGLVTPKALSKGLPFDFLSMIVAAETLRRQVGDQTRIIHYIPDVTAKQNSFVDEKGLQELAVRTANAAKAIAHHFGLLDRYTVIRGSEIEHDPLRQSLLIKTNAYAGATDIPDNFKGYLAEQLADMAYLRETFGGKVKISWTMARNPDGAGKGLDETFFDGHYTTCFGNDLDFAYIAPGRRLDSKANRACPYTAVAGEPRLSLTDKFSIASAIETSGLKPDSDTVKDALRYWNQIVDGLEELFGLDLPSAQNKTERIEKIRYSMTKALQAQP